MAKDLYRAHDDSLIVTRFAGGRERGPCIQITTNESAHSYLSLTRQQVGMVYSELRKFMFAVDNGR